MMWKIFKDWLYDQYRSHGMYGDNWRQVEKAKADYELRSYRLEQSFANRPLLDYDFTDEQLERYQARIAGIDLRLARLLND